MRLVIVSNRLPVTIARNGDEFSFEESVGGLATGLSSYLKSLKMERGNIQTISG